MSRDGVSQDGGFLPEIEGNTEKELKEDSPILLPMFLNKNCRYCLQIPIDEEIDEIFGILVCRNCRYKELKLITKTSCLSNYLLTSEELRNFSFLDRPNPHKGTWSNMNLYLEDQIVEFAVKKWGSMEEIRKTKEKRGKALEDRKIRKLKDRIKDLKRRTRVKGENVEKHVHEFVVTLEGTSRCKCGMVIEQEEL